MDKCQSFWFSHYKRKWQGDDRAHPWTIIYYELKNLTGNLQHWIYHDRYKIRHCKNTQKGHPNFLPILSAFWWRWCISWYLKDEEKGCQVEGRHIYKEHTQRVRKNTCGAASSLRWRGARAKQQSRVSSKREGWIIWQEPNWFECFYST